MTKHNHSVFGWGKITLLLAIFTLLVGLVAAPAAQAVPSGPEMTLQTLLDKAAVNGSVRVIIGLDVAFTPEGDLAGTQSVQSQQMAIQAAQARVLQELESYSDTAVTNFKYIPAMAAVVDAAALAKLAALPDVAYIEEDKLAAPSLASSIPVIGADDAWAAGYTGAGQTIAILDTGVDSSHSFFQGGKVVSEACYSTTFAPNGSTTVCPNGNDPTFQDWQIGPGAGVDCIDQVIGSTAVSNCKHGTHVAGIAAGNNGGANIGVAKDANLIAVQVFSYFSGGIVCDNCALTYSSDQVRGLERVYELRNDFDIAAVNMSLGGSTLYTSACDTDEKARKDAIDNLRSRGIATIIATGNNGATNGIAAPACISSAISVSSTDDYDNVSSFSNVASIMDLYAPGSSITSSLPDETLGTWGGTSMATPHVAGAWAIMRDAAPNASIDQILQLLKDTGTLIDDNRSGGIVTDIPRINVDQASNLFKPNANNDGAATPANTPVSINVIANDIDLLGDLLTISEVGFPINGTANLISSTTIEYIPASPTFSGADSFSYTITDPYGGTDTATVIVVVDGESVFLPGIMK